MREHELPALRACRVVRLSRTAIHVRFEVASIKRNTDAEAARAAVPAFVPVVPGRSQTPPGGRLRRPAMTVRETHSRHLRIPQPRPRRDGRRHAGLKGAKYRFA